MPDSSLAEPDSDFIRRIKPEFSRILLDYSLSSREFTPALIDLVIRGYVSIGNTSITYTGKRDGLDGFEIDFINCLFPESGSLTFQEVSIALNRKSGELMNIIYGGVMQEGLVGRGNDRVSEGLPEEVPKPSLPSWASAFPSLASHTILGFSLFFIVVALIGLAIKHPWLILFGALGLVSCVFIFLVARTFLASQLLKPASEREPEKDEKSKLLTMLGRRQRAELQKFIQNSGKNFLEGSSGKYAALSYSLNQREWLTDVDEEKRRPLETLVGRIESSQTFKVISLESYLSEVA